MNFLSKQTTDGIVQELIESYINGNRSWVKEQILALSKKKAIRVVLLMLPDLAYDGYDSRFVSIMKMGE